MGSKATEEVIEALSDTYATACAFPFEMPGMRVVSLLAHKLKDEKYAALCQEIMDQIRAEEG